MTVCPQTSLASPNVCYSEGQAVPGDRSWAEEPSVNEMLACLLLETVSHVQGWPLLSVGITGLPHHTHFKTPMKYTFKKHLCFHLHSQLRFSRCLTTDIPGRCKVPLQLLTHSLALLYPRALSTYPPSFSGMGSWTLGVRDTKQI